MVNAGLPGLDRSQTLSRRERLDLTPNSSESARHGLGVGPASTTKKEIKKVLDFGVESRPGDAIEQCRTVDLAVHLGTNGSDPI
ncbi:hypothetical protein RHGRI_030269 [Rhododendron griersonianum]|uniref:Uncharacterized protein n=1 Tax=Rhododendron griersonianum TaxID=479676 RepID=A0AAV6IT67_9ERIC|nr:hypothetical protein RHGRI_030269 [Rhododendron griersonianum]